MAVVMPMASYGAVPGVFVLDYFYSSIAEWKKPKERDVPRPSSSIMTRLLSVTFCIMYAASRISAMKEEVFKST